VLVACKEDQTSDVEPHNTQNDSIDQIKSLSSASSAQAVSDDLCEMSELDSDLLDTINLVRSEGRFCGSDFYPAVEPVVWNCKLRDASLNHSQDMGAVNFVSHTGSDGLMVNYRVNQAGYDWLKISENIAAGYPGVELVINAWLGSPDHCATLMGDEFKDVGVGVDLPENADYGDYWTLLMGKPIS